ncbi:MAG: HAD family phosphatase [Candidatus Aminicenantes bacterium]|jgi:putative hydrolase of the HAD superfamily
MIKSIISDLGNVVIFFDNFIFFRKISEYSPLSDKEIFERLLAHTEVSRAFDEGKLTPEEFYTQAIAILKAGIDQETFYSLYNDVFDLNPYVLETLKSLRANYRLVLCSNTDESRFGYIKKKFPEIFIFDRYVVSFEVGVLKPHQRIYEAALKEAGSEAEESVFIDDREENIASAERLGFNTILFGRETDLKREFHRIGVQI